MSNLISIIIPCYNAEKYIADTIQSVINQTYSNWELIIVNDGSTDNSKLIIEGFLNDYPNIKLINKQNTGVSDSRNIGMSEAQGEFIALLDADDIWEIGNLSTKIDAIERLPDVDWVFSDAFDADENMQIIKVANQGTDNEILNSILLWEGEVVPYPCSNIVFRKKCFDQGIKFDPLFSTAADQDFTLQLAKNHNAYYIKQPLWRYRIHNNNMSKNVSLMEKDHIGVYQKAKQNGLFKSKPFERKCFSNLYLIIAGSWWKNGNNKYRALYFVLLSFITYPPIVFKILKKIITNKKS
jgi:glycosyltransferase involved in cell wall biosynthesis